MAESKHRPPPPAATWTDLERSAWAIPEKLKPSQWAERHRHLYRSNIPGPLRHDNAPYTRGIMDIISRPGCVQGNVIKAGQTAVSEAMRSLLGYWAHVEPDPVGLTLPSRDKGREIVKSDILPLFRRTRVLRELIGRPSREALIESIDLLNGFHLALMWSGSATSMASNPYRRVINDEVDKFEPWTGEEVDAIAATQVRLTTYGDRRLQVNVSTPTTQAGKISQLFNASTIKLFFYVPCPRCGHLQRLIWTQIKYLGRAQVERWLGAARAAAHAAAKDGAFSYRQEDHLIMLDSAEALGEHVARLESLAARMGEVKCRSDLADVLTSERERLIWYECVHCHGRIHDAEKIAMIRRGRWTTAEGFVVDYWGNVHEDAEQVERWPDETRVGLQISAIYCLWIHWSTLVSEWLRAQDDPEALFFFITNRLGEAFEFRLKRSEPSLYEEKCARATLEPGIVPKWAWLLLATVDTQPDHFYVVIRAWGAGMKSQRVWHGKLMTFDELDRLVFATSWPVEAGAFAPMAVTLTLIDSGGTADRLINISRTQQVYEYVQPRQPVVRAIKGASRPGPGLYWPMKNPMGAGGKGTITDLRAVMVDTHKCNDLLADLIASGPPVAGTAEGQPARPDEPERWLLNKAPDPEYNQHMAALVKTLDPKTKAELWKPRRPGTRCDYRDCEAYQIAGCYLANVHLLPAEQEVIAWKQQLAQPAPKPQPEPREAADAWTPRSL
ncbi:MAG TPA: terminase gpA endonuclease subunit [Phycisphaerae bacterium]|nr:terminase gpA endonuclease subunit [Phycisphaerae bacterium]HUT61215.1 terminase gpA endonuclease subunit [Phycisphaerae bacterium]